MYPVLRSLALQLHSAVTGSYVSGTHSIAFINCLNEQIAKDIARSYCEARTKKHTLSTQPKDIMYYADVFPQITFSFL
ncbi:protein hypothetical protein [Limosa lapponica baueri]|uniref:Uncharacterized protein n=1 Tax=Limosa lapponica baueri TaxID=1758121 RepID=A0A2I0T1N7_LIMLA|nr:protein hypothetical protein [Limosa lapponica baueri]